MDCYNFIPHIHEERLVEPYKRKKPAKIFVCSMGEIFDNKVKQEWRDRIIKVAEDNPQHIFFLLTKQPQNIQAVNYPKNVWIGISWNGLYDTIDQNALNNLFQLKDVAIKYISLEPYLKEIDVSFLGNFNWVIIGGKTGHSKFKPPTEWVDKAVEYCNANNIPVFIKANCDYSVKLRQYPGMEIDESKVKGRE